MLRFGLILAAVVFALDQASKYWILDVLQFSPPGCLEAHMGCRKIEISGVFDLSMNWNYGVSFGMLNDGGSFGRWALVALSLGIAGMFIAWMRTAERPLTGAALGLVVGGALGNLIDRVRFGAVTDFLDFSGPWFRIGEIAVGFPWIFNVADAAITVGAALLALDFLRNGEGERTGKKAAA